MKIEWVTDVRYDGQRKGLKEMVDKYASLIGASDDMQFRVMSGSLPGVAGRLHNLLTRIEVPETWTS